MSKNSNETTSERQQESNRVSPNRANAKNRLTPASREEWAEVLATADRYY